MKTFLILLVLSSLTINVYSQDFIPSPSEIAGKYIIEKNVDSDLGKENSHYLLFENSRYKIINPESEFKSDLENKFLKIKGDIYHYTKFVYRPKIIEVLAESQYNEELTKAKSLERKTLNGKYSRIVTSYTAEAGPHLPSHAGGGGYRTYHSESHEFKTKDKKYYFERPITNDFPYHDDKNMEIETEIVGDSLLKNARIIKIKIE